MSAKSLSQTVTRPGEYVFEVKAKKELQLNILQLANQTKSANQIKPITVTVNLVGAAGYAQVNNLFVGRADQKQNLQLTINHQAPNTTARFIGRGILFDQAQSDFSGLINVEPKAQNTDSWLEHRTLLLSDQASSNPVPALEIKADQVKASHAATVSHLDPLQQFYLRSRGLSDKMADGILIEAFISDLLPNFNPHVQKLINTLINNKQSKND